MKTLSNNSYLLLTIFFINRIILFCSKILDINFSDTL